MQCFQYLIIADGNIVGNEVIPEIMDLAIEQSCRGYFPAIISHYQSPWVYKTTDNLPMPVWPGKSGDEVRGHAGLDEDYAPWIRLAQKGVDMLRRLKTDDSFSTFSTFTYIRRRPRKFQSWDCATVSLEQNESFCFNKISGLELIEINAAGQIAGVKSDGIIPCLPVSFEQQCCRSGSRGDPGGKSRSSDYRGRKQCGQ